jgi:hypothetical protein
MRYDASSVMHTERKLSGEDEHIRLLREILKWIRFAGMKEAKTVLTSVLDDPQKILAYHLSDGTRGTVEIAKITGIGSTSTIARYWQTWQNQSLGENVPVRGGVRFKRSFDIEELGFIVPDATTTKHAKGD